MIRLGCIVTLGLLLGACTSIEQTSTKVDNAARQADTMRTAVERNASSSAVIRTKRPRLAGEEVLLKSNALPAIFDQTIQYSTKGSQSLLQSLEDIAAATNIPISISEVLRQNDTVGAVPMAGAMGAGSDAISGTLTIDYVGSQRGLFDEIASKGNASWRYNAASKSVEFYRYETRTISVYVPSAAKSISASISLSGVGGGGSGSASVAQSMTVDPWASIMQGIQAILSDGQGSAGKAGAAGAGAASSGSAVNGSAIANPELGLITVTARPALMNRITRYVSSINARFSKNVLVDIKIFSVTLDEQTSAGFNLSMLYANVGKSGASLVGPGVLQAGINTPGILTVNSDNPLSPANGSQIVAKALSQFGKVALQQQGQVLAINGQPAPIQVANEITYVASSSIISTPNVGSTVTQTPGTKVVGFTANFLPLILGDNRILLQYQIQLSSLAAPMTANAQGVVTPNIASQSLQQQAFVRDGQAIVLFGYDSQRDGIDSALSPGGLSKAAHNERQMVVIVIQVNTGSRDGSV